jgi:hypothetical protein
MAIIVIVTGACALNHCEQDHSGELTSSIGHNRRNQCPPQVFTSCTIERAKGVVDRDDLFTKTVSHEKADRYERWSHYSPEYSASMSCDLMKFLYLIRCLVHSGVKLFRMTAPLE